MNIDLLSKMIHELILTNNEVTLPGFGTFVAGSEPASFSDKGYTINPPYRRLFFVTTEGSDNLLLNLYAESNGISLQDAKRIITSFLSGLAMEFTRRRMIQFPGLGRLRMTRENTAFFITDADLDIYIEGLGLGPVSLRNHRDVSENIEDIIYPAIEMPYEVVEPAPAPEAKPEPASEPEFEAEPEPASEPEFEAKSEPARESKPESAPVAAPVRKKKTLPVAVKVLMWLFGLIVLSVASLYFLAAFAPDLLDMLLYTKEEIAILRYNLQ